MGTYTPTVMVEAAFGYGPRDDVPPDAWVDVVTNRHLTDLRVDRGRRSEFDTFPPGRITARFADAERRFDPNNASGPYFGDLKPNVPIRVRAELPDDLDIDETFGDLGDWDVMFTDQGAPSVAGNRLVLPFAPAAGNTELRHNATCRLASETTVTVEIDQLPDAFVADGATTFGFFLATGTRQARFLIVNGLLETASLDVVTGSSWGRTERPHSPAAHRWLRFVASRQFVHFDVSPDGDAWTRIDTIRPMLTGDYRVHFFTGFSGTSGSPDDVLLSTFSIAETHPRFRGFADAWVASVGKFSSTVTLTATDWRKLTANDSLPETVHEHVLRSRSDLALFWPLSADEGGVATDVSGHGRHGIIRGNVERDSDGVIYAGSALRLHEGSVRTRHRVTTSQHNTTFVLYVQSERLDDGSYILLWQGASDPDERIHLWYSRSGNTSRLHSIVPIATAGYQRWAFGDTDGFSNVVLDDGRRHQLRFGITWTASPLLHFQTLAVDGRSCTVDDFNIGATGAASGEALVLGRPAGNIVGSGTPSDAGSWPGKVDHFAIVNANLSLADMRDLLTVAYQPWDGDTTGARLHNIANLIGIPSTMRAIDPGGATCRRASLNSANTDEYLTRIANTEQGKVFTDAAGRLALHQSARQRLKDAPAVVFSDDETDIAAGDAVAVVQHSPPQMPLDDRFVFNKASVARGSGSVAQKVDNSEGSPYGPRERIVSGLLLRTDAAALGIAHRIAQRNAEPMTRVESWTVAPENHPDTWADVLGLDIGAHVEVSLTPQGIGDPVVLPLEVEMVTDEITAGAYGITFRGSPRDPNIGRYFTFDGDGATQGFDAGVLA